MRRKYPCNPNCICSTCEKDDETCCYSHHELSCVYGADSQFCLDYAGGEEEMKSISDVLSEHCKELGIKEIELPDFKPETEE